VSATVPLKFIDNLALTRKMPLAFANMAFNMREVGDNEVPVHTHNNPPAEAGVPSTDHGGGKRRAGMAFCHSGSG